MVTQHFLLSAFFLVVFVCSIEGYQLKRSTQLTASTCDEVKDKPCSSDQECFCSPKKPFICNSKNTCGILTWLEHIIRLLKIPCPSIFKKRCKFDIDCAGCKTHKLRCEERECVKDRRPETA